MRLRVYKQREKRHVKHNRLRVEQGDPQGLAKVKPSSDIDNGRVAWLGGPHFVAHKRQIRRTQKLQNQKQVWLGSQDCRHASHRRPHQHLVSRDDTQSGG